MPVSSGDATLVGDDQPTAAVPPSRTSTSIGPRWLPSTLIVLATCIAVLSTLTTWVKTQALDTDAWVENSDALLADPEVRDALSDYLVEELFTAVDVAAELESRLPDQLAGVAGPLAAALRAPADRAVEQLLASRRFAELWSSANRFTHERFVAVLRNETSAATSADDGIVALELGVVIRSLGERLGLSERALDRIPPDAGSITIVESEQLASAQSAVQLLDAPSWFLFVVVIALYALAVFLARGRRDRALFGVGVGLVSGGVAVLALRAIGVRTLVEVFSVEGSDRSLGRIVGRIATQLLAELAWTAITFGVLIALFAALLSGARWAVAARRRSARVAGSSGAVVGAGVFMLLGLLWWNPGHAFDRGVSVLALVVLVVAAVSLLVVRLRSEITSE